MLKVRCNQVLKSPTLPNCEAEAEVCPPSKIEENVLGLLCMSEMEKKLIKMHSISKCPGLLGMSEVENPSILVLLPTSCAY